MLSGGFDLPFQVLDFIEKNLAPLLRYLFLLLQCKKVELSGGKCICALHLSTLIAKEGCARVSRGFIAESGCQGAVVRPHAAS
jgi:hypothetical protein